MADQCDQFEEHKEMMLLITLLDTQDSIIPTRPRNTSANPVMRGYQRDAPQGTRAHTRRATTQERPYTSAEDAWLVRNWGGEGNFLHAHGLTMATEESRSAGRRMARALIAVDSEDEDEARHEAYRRPRYAQQQQEGRCEDSQCMQLTVVPRQLEPYLSAEELAWVMEWYRSTEHFMRCMQLDPYKEADCHEAAQDVRNLMRDEANGEFDDLAIPLREMRRRQREAGRR